MLPITKAVEKYMLPVGTRPVIDYVVQDIIAAGVRDIYFIVGEDSTQLERYYGNNEALNTFLQSKGKQEVLDLIQPPQDVTMHFITQPATEKYGTSVPVGFASEYVDDDESVLVIMGDQFFYREDSGSNAADLIELVSSRGVTAGLLGTEVSWDDITKGGAIENDEAGNYVRIVEKPTREEAPSNLNNASFYLLNKQICEFAKELPANPKRGEYEITDAINAYVEKGGRVVVGKANGEYMDCGTPEGWLQANNRIMQP